MIYEEEVKECLEYIEFLYKNNVDALIMQDIGLIDTVLKKYPNLEVHASTQCHNHNKEGISFLKSLGVKRIVLDRELSLDEINDIDIDIEKEYRVKIRLNDEIEVNCKFKLIRVERGENGIYTISGRFTNQSKVDKMSLVQYCMNKNMENLNK